MKSMISPRNRLLAFFMAVIMPGLGQVYNGQLMKGVSVLIFFCLIPLLLTRAVLFLPLDYQLMGFAVAVVCAATVYFLSIADSVRTAKNSAEAYSLTSYNRWYFYSTMWLIGIAVMVSADSYMKAHIGHPFKIVTDTMAPAVLKGDYVITDKTAYNHTPVKNGDIIIHVYPNDRSKVYIRQVVGLPGEKVKQLDQSVMTAPNGAVLVKGLSDNIDTRDSRHFGPVDMRDIVGKVQHIYFSKGKEGIRWERIGMIVNQ